MSAAFPKPAGSELARATPLWIALVALPLLAGWLHGAWVSEDAHITFRAIDNLLDGRGLRWNPDERVQVFTHPLWLFAVTPLYAASGSVAWSLTLLGLGCTLGAFVVLARALRAGPLLLVGLGLAWLLSGCLTRYATSGFENPLTHLLLAVQAAQILALRPGARVPWARLCFVAALAGVNRLDTLALHGPVLAALFIAAPRGFAWRPAAAGLTPLFAWLAFSLCYFGFLLPNTAYAKLAPGVPFSVQLASGLAYARDFVTQDFESAVVLLTGWAAAVAFGRRALRDRDPRCVALSGMGVGSLAYVGLVVIAGGDFLAGRHFSAPMFASLCVGAAWCAERAADLSDRNDRGEWLAARKRRAALTAGLALLVSAMAGAALRSAIPATVLEHSAARLTLGTTGWEPTDRARQFAATGRRINEESRALGATVAVLPVIGMATREIDRDLILVDPYALADPLLARLQPKHTGAFKPGHAERAIPPGYLRVRAGEATTEFDPALAEYYARLRTVVAGPLFSLARWRTIAGFQLGQFDPPPPTQ